MKRYVDSFLEYMTVIREASVNTIDAYRRDLDRFSEAMEMQGASQPQEVTEELLANYFFGLEKSSMTDATLARHMSSVRAFFRFLVENDDVQRNITDILEQPGVKRTPPQTLGREEIDRLLDAPDPSRPMGMRDRAILELLYASGLKVGELVALYPEDVDLRAAMVKIDSSREEKARSIPFGEKARGALISWIGSGREYYVPPLAHAPLFVNTRGTGLSRQSVWKMVRNYARQAGIRKEITPGTLRHSFASHLMENGADLRSLSRLMGYTRDALAGIYEVQDEERLRDVYMRAQKRG
ncbi:MAG: tyrosine-type recombinase/integrase [Lachnospiraceae bacterium]|nr:tyrosine-type recombinase/integrase [Lachnospiraceae bacterium]